MLPAIPIAIILLGGGAYAASVKKEEEKKGQMTQQRAVIFETALNEVKDPAKLRTLAKAFGKQGLKPQAELLEKRARLRELSPKVKEERRAVFRKAMASKDANAVKTVATVFEKEGATGAANALRKYAGTLPAVPANPATAIAAVTPPAVKV